MASENVAFFTMALSTRITRHFSKLNLGTSAAQRQKLGYNVKLGRTWCITGTAKRSIGMGQGQEGKMSS